MLMKTLSVLLVVLVMNLSFVFAATDKETKDAKFTAKVKSEIAKLGTGEDAKIQVKLKDGTKLKGYISEADDEQFIIVDAKTGRSTPVSYSQVQTGKGNNLSKKAVGYIVIGAIFVTLVVLLATQLK